jgi:hypothetical protein
MSTCIFGGDISLYSVDKESYPKIDEFRMRNVIDQMK